MDQNLFYDSQLENDNITWRLYSQPYTESGEEVQSDSDYSELVAKGIMRDTSLEIGISHRYSSGCYDPFRITETLAGLLPGYLGKVGQKVVQNLNPKTIMPIINAAGISANSINSISMLMNRNIEALGTSFNLAQMIGSEFMSAFDLVNTYTGSDVSIFIPLLETIWFHEKGNSVRSRIANLQKRVLGDLTHLGGLFGLQAAPNNYLPKLENLSADIKFTGSFMLKLGNLYSIDNLIITSVDYELSTINARVKDDNGNIVSSGEPLYAIVKIRVEPAAFITKEKLKKYLRLS